MNMISLDHGAHRYENFTRDGLLQVGVPEAVIDAAELAAAKAGAETAIDAAAEAARARKITLSPGMAMTYAVKAAEARAFETATAAQKADPSRWPMLAPEAGVLEIDLAQHAAVVRAKDSGFTALGGLIEAARAGGKADVRSRLKLHTVEEARDAAIDALNAL
jgi:NADH dehydrogenase/NADH:ubiquinone oxidoreductase subunit G